MTNRVLLDSSGLKVSKPGVNVLTAGPLDLIYSSDASAFTLQTTGEMDCNWSDAYNYRSYAYGKTYPSPPLVHLQQVVSSTDVRDLSATGSFAWQWSYTFTNLAGNTLTAQHTVKAYVTASALMVFSHITDTDNVHPPNFRLRYTVLDFNM